MFWARKGTSDHEEKRSDLMDEYKKRMTQFLSSYLIIPKAYLNKRGVIEDIGFIEVCVKFLIDEKVFLGLYDMRREALKEYDLFIHGISKEEE